MGLLDNQKLQTGVATLLGVDDESDQANVIARQWASDNDYSDSEEDTLRHILLGGFMQSVEGEGLGRLGKGIAGKLINVRESTDEESLIDVDNNNFGRQLRKELINRDKDSSVEGFVEAAKNFVHNLRTEKEVRDVDGLRPRMSTAGQEKQTDMAKGGAILMNNQMQQFAEGGLEDEGGMIDKVSGNEVPVGGTKEGVRDDIPVNVSKGEFIFPEDVTRFIGLDKLMQLRQDAKMGLKKMEAMGQMGNSDEATMDDDMPFEMADLVVVGGAGEPMEFADGGFIPVKDYTEVQDMISDKAQKGAGYANGGMVQLQTADVPMTTDSTEPIDYEAYMGSVQTVTKEYRNAAGESVVITFINGVPTLPIPDGYTLYTPVPGDTTSVAGNVVAVTSSNVDASGNDTRQDYDGSEIKTGFAPEPIDYANMSDEVFAAQMQRESGGLYQFGRIVGLGIGSMVPGGMLVIGGGMRSHARKGEARLNSMIEGASGEYRDELIAIRDGWLKANSLKPTADSNALVAGVDSYLARDGYTKKQRTAALGAVTVPVISEEVQNNINTILEGNDAYVQSKEEAEAVQKVVDQQIASGGRSNSGDFQYGDFLGSDLTQETKNVLQTVENSGLPLTQNQLQAQLEENRLGIDPQDQEAMKQLVAPTGIGVARPSQTETAMSGSQVEPSSQTVDAFGTPFETRSLANAMDKSNEGLSGAANFIQSQVKPSQTEAVVGEAPTGIGVAPARPYDYMQDTEVGRGASAVGRAISKAANYVFDNALGVKGKALFSDTPDTVTQQPVVTQNVIDSMGVAQPSYVDNSNRIDSMGVAQPSSQAENITRGFDDTSFVAQSLPAENITRGFDDIPVVTQSSPAAIQQQMGDAFGSGNVFTDPRQAEQAVKNLSDPNNAYVKDVAAQQQIRLKNENTARELRAEKAAENAKQNNAFQDAANKLFDKDDKEYRGGVLYSTAGKNAGKRINTTYMDAANLATPNDGLKYKDGILRDKDGKAVNNAFQKMANLLTKNDGRSYVGGNLIDDKTKLAYVPKDRSTTPFRDPFATTAVSDRNNGMDALTARVNANTAQAKAKAAKDAAKASATRAAATAAAARMRAAQLAARTTTSNKRTASDKAKEIRDQNQANIKSSQKAISTGSVRPKARTFKEGGLIQKPTTTKKPAKAKTNKRGLAARK